MTAGFGTDDGADVASLTDDALDAALAETDHLLGPKLAELFTIPAGLENRTRVEVQEALLTRSTAAAATDLVGLGWHTFRLLFTDHDLTAETGSDAEPPGPHRSNTIPWENPT